MNKSKVEKVNLFSEILDKEMPMVVYLPEGYDSITPLPVLYFLHGRSGSEDIMYEVEIDKIADQTMADGKINHMIIVCPRIENSRGLNSSLVCQEVLDSSYYHRTINLGRYEDYFIKEVVPFIDKTYHTINDRKDRYIGGVSAGGYAALHLMFRNQQLFSKVGGHMPAIELKLEEEDKPYYNDLEVWEAYDPIYIASNHHITSDIKVYLDAGDKDEGRLYEGCLILHNILKEKGINTQNYIFQGNHSAEYIQSNMNKYLKFYGS
jgi:enterochelin esterase-like enzyme